MNEIAIYGAGGFGRETALLIDQINALQPVWKLVGFFDDHIEKGKEVDGLPVLGGIKQVNEVPHNLALALAIADPTARRRIAEGITNKQVRYPVLAHPRAMLGSETNFFGRGCILTAGCILTTGIILGEFAIVNLLSTVGHDAKIGSFCTLMPSSNISGNVEIGEETMIGTGAKILQNLTIGARCKVGAGAVLTGSLQSDQTAVGVPARPVTGEKK